VETEKNIGTHDLQRWRQKKIQARLIYTGGERINTGTLVIYRGGERINTGTLDLQRWRQKKYRHN
jgi:hypothetical protein